MKYIGIVDWTTEDKSGNKIAGVLPFYEVSGIKWSDVNLNNFEPDGKVFWFKAAAKEKDLIFFTVKESYKDDGYRFNIDRCELAKEVLDFRNLGFIEDVRKAFASGLRYSDHLPDRVYIWCKGGSIIGPVNLSRSIDDKLVFNAPQLHEIPCYSTDDTPIQELHLDSGNRFICQDQNPLNICSYVDWDTNRNVIKRAVEFAINNSKKTTITSINVKELINNTYQQLKDSDDSAKLSLQINRLKRTVDIIKQVEISDEWADELIKDLVTLPTVKEKFEIVREKIEKETSEKIRKEFEFELKQIERVRDEKKKLDEEIQENINQLVEIKKEVDSQTNDIEQEVEKKIKSIIDKPANLIAESAFLKAVIPYLSLGNNTNSTNNISTKSEIKWNISSTKISSADEFRKQINKGFRKIGVKPDVGIIIHAALTAGIMPILSGFNSGAAIETYSKIACGGRIFHVPVSPTSIDASNLFGSFDGSENRFIQHENNLLQFIETAKQYPEPGIVVFEGINRAPTESYFIPILEAIFFKKSLTLYLNKNGTQQLEWCKNLLPVATLVEGPTTLPLSVDIWSRSILIDAQGQYSQEIYNDLSEIELNNNLFELFEDTDFEIDHIFEKLPEFDYQRILTNRLINGLSHFYDLSDEKDQIRLEKILVESIIFPLIAMIDSDEERDTIIKNLIPVSIDQFKDIQTTTSIIKRVMRKIT